MPLEAPALAQPGRQRLADDGRDARRADERPGPRRPVRRRDAEALVDQQHDADVRRVRGRAHRLGAVRLQDGVRRTRSTGSRTSTGFFGNFIGKPGPMLEPQGLTGTGRHPA